MCWFSSPTEYTYFRKQRTTLSHYQKFLRMYFSYIQSHYQSNFFNFFFFFFCLFLLLFPKCTFDCKGFISDFWLDQTVKHKQDYIAVFLSSGSGTSTAVTLQKIIWHTKNLSDVFGEVIWIFYYPNIRQDVILLF